MRVVAVSSMRVALRYKQIDAMDRMGVRSGVWGIKGRHQAVSETGAGMPCTVPLLECLAPGGRGQAAQYHRQCVFSLSLSLSLPYAI